MTFSSWDWIQHYRWRLLLIGIVAFLIISPSTDVYDRLDNVITPLTATIFLAIFIGTAEKKLAVWLLGALTLIWLVVSIATEGSGIFAGKSLLAPLLFIILLVVVFLLLARWLSRAVLINTEVLCAAVCGYLLLGVVWTDIYTVVDVMIVRDPGASSGFVSSTSSKVSFGDLLYFSYTTLTTTGYGDIIPKDPVIRMLAVLEAIVGVFYNTIVIARFVGLYGVKPQPTKDSSSQ